MFRGGISILLAVALASCTRLPELPPRERLSISDVVDTVECEFRDAFQSLRGQYRFLENWAVGVGFTLIAEDFSEFSPTISISPPIVSGINQITGAKLYDTFSLAINGDLSGRARRTVNFKLAFNFIDLDRYTCVRRFYGSSPLTSDLGIKESMERVLSAVTGEDVTGDPLSIGTTIQFIVSSSGRITPSASFSRARGPGSFDPSGFFTATRLDDHLLDLTMYPRPVPPGPAEVVIVGRRR